MHSKKILNHLQNTGIAVITITHDMEFVADMFDRVIVMADKKIIADTSPENIFWQDDIIEKSCISRPQIGEIAKLLKLEQPIIFRADMINFLKAKQVNDNE